MERLVGDAARARCNEAGVDDCAVDSFLFNTSPQEAAASLPDTADVEVLDPKRIGQDATARATVADFIEALDASPASPIRRRLGMTETYQVTVGPDGAISRIEAQYQP